MLLISIMVIGVITYIFANWYDKKYCEAWLYDQCGQPAKVIITLFRTGEYTDYFKLSKADRSAFKETERKVPSYTLTNNSTGRVTEIYLHPYGVTGDMSWMSDIERDHLCHEVDMIDRRVYWKGVDDKRAKDRSEGEVRKDETYEQFKHLIHESERRVK